jgi:ACS family D-galactonate transporter-like MFS transporter
MSATTQTLPSPIPRRRWRIALLLGLGVLINYFDRVNLTVSHAALHADFGISDLTFGYLSSAYVWTYGLCQLPIGVILDRFGVRRVGRISTFLWSIASFAGAASPGIPTFFAARLLLGIGEAPTFPANAKAIGKWFPRSERSFATSIFDCAAKLASAVGIPIIGIFLIHFGWRWSFAATGLISFFYFLLFYAIYRDPSDDPKLTETERNLILDSKPATQLTAPDPPRPSFLYVLSQPKIIGTFLGFGAYNYTFFLLLTWLPSYLAQELHIDLLHSFLYTAVPWLVATVAELCIGGLLTDALIHRGFNEDRVRRTVLIGGMFFGLGILGAPHVHTATGALFWITISLAGLSSAAPIAWSIPSLIAPPSRVGTAGGIQNFSGQLSGFIAPMLTGYVVFHTHHFAAAFTVAAAYLLIGIAGYAILLGRIDQIPTRTAA